MTQSDLRAASRPCARPYPASLRTAAQHVLVLFVSLLLALGSVACDDTSDGEPTDTVEGDDSVDTSTPADLVADADATDEQDTSSPDQQMADTEEMNFFPDGTSTSADTGADTSPPIDLSNDELEIASVSPSTGPSTGQNIVEIGGAGFTPDMEVFFGPYKVAGLDYRDSGSVSVVAPQGAAGTVDVKVVNDNGNDTLDDAYTWFDAITLTSIDPQRTPTSGGVPFALTGTGFTGDAAVSIAGRTAIDVVIESDTMITGITPPGAAGPADVRVTSAAGSTLAPEMIEYFEPTSISLVYPGAGPTTGGNTVRIEGAGFDTESTVLIGSQTATVTNATATELIVVVPAQTAGPRDVVVQSADGSARLADGYVYIGDASSTDVTAVVPSSGPSAGGNEVVVVGSALDGPNLAVTIGGTPVTGILETTPYSLRVVAPAGTVGTADVAVTHDSGTDTLPDGYTFLSPFDIQSISPAEGPVAGGTTVQILGEGFTDATSVRFGPLTAASFTVVSDTEINAVTPAGAGGFVDVEIRTSDRATVATDAFRYIDTLRVYAIVPTRGSQAGGTLVTAAGTGFAPGAVVNVDGIAAADVAVLDPNTIQFRTPPNDPGIVTVEVVQDGVTAPSPIDFEYFDPTSRFGGGWGDPITGAVNVTVLVARTEMPIPDAYVILNTDTGTPYQGLTDANGQITFSGADIQGTQTVTASKEGFTSTTIETIDAENVTLFISDLSSNTGMPPPPIDPGIIQGNITGAEKVALITDPNVVRFSIVVTSQSSPFATNPDPGVDNQVPTGNGPYRLVSRIGDVALIGMCGLLNTVTGDFTPKYMAMRRFVNVPEGSVQDIDLDCTIRLDQEVQLRFVDSPLGMGPNGNGALIWLNIGPEGVHQIDVPTGPGTTLFTTQAPLTGPLAGMSYYMIGGAFTDGGSPYSLAQRDNVTDFSGPIEFGPLIQMPQLVSPVAGGLVTDGYVEWTMDNPERIDLYRITILEPASPVPTPIWEIYLPRTATSFDLPQLLPGSGAADPYTGDAFIDFDVYRRTTPGFDFDTFTENDLEFDAQAAFVYQRRIIRF